MVLLKNNTLNKQYGFTLAEILITLGIIGIIASITIPALINLINEANYKSLYRKAYATISQALLSAQNDSTLVPFSGTNGGIGLQDNFLAMKSCFNISKECTTSNLYDCWNTSGESFRSEETGVFSFVDNSGMAWRTRNTDKDLSTPIILVDTNGGKNPNKYGQDRFPFCFSNTGNSYAGGYIINGIPSKIIPLDNQLDNSLLECPSYATHPCYYTSWLYGTH